MKISDTLQDKIEKNTQDIKNLGFLLRELKNRISFFVRNSQLLLETKAEQGIEISYIKKSLSEIILQLSHIHLRLDNLEKTMIFENGKRSAQRKLLLVLKDYWPIVIFLASCFLSVRGIFWK